MNTPAYLVENIGLDVVSPVTNGDLRRSPAALLGVVSALFVDTAPRYKRRDITGDGAPETFCNVFVRDFCDAMGVRLPRPMRANDIISWLTEEHLRGDWSTVDEAAAVAAADAGKVVIAGWYNRNGGSGHLAVVLPSLGEPGVHIAQAGVTNFSRGKLASGFGTKPVTFWAHP